jgi:hypothetical protein
MQIACPKQEDIGTRRYRRCCKVEIQDIEIAKRFRVLLDNREGRWVIE